MLVKDEVAKIAVGAILGPVVGLLGAKLKAVFDKRDARAESAHLLSETTRALVGNDLPAGVSVHDLGEQNLKDIQHERVYELSLDGQRAETRPLKTHAVDNRVDAMAQRFEERVTSYVEQQLEAAFTKGKPPEVPVRLAARGLGIAGLALLMMIGVIVVAILALRWLFF